MADPTASKVADEDLAIAEGALRVFLERSDEWHSFIEKRLERAHAAKDAMEASLRSDLQETLLGRHGLAFKDGAGGGVIDVAARASNRKARTAAIVRIDAHFRALEAQLLPKQARAPSRGVPAGVAA